MIDEVSPGLFAVHVCVVLVLYTIDCLSVRFILTLLCLRLRTPIFHFQTALALNELACIRSHLRVILVQAIYCKSS